MIVAAVTVFCGGRRPLFRCALAIDSFLPHCEAMKKTGKELVILEMPGIGLDIDNPHELDLLLQRDGDTHAQTAAAVVGLRGG